MPRYFTSFFIFIDYVLIFTVDGFVLSYMPFSCKSSLCSPDSFNLFCVQEEGDHVGDHVGLPRKPHAKGPQVVQVVQTIITTHPPTPG